MAGDPLFHGLPSMAALQAEEGRADTFADLRDWVRRVAREGGLSRAGSSMDVWRRLAIINFLLREAGSGLRQKRAKELLAVLTAEPDFIEGVAIANGQAEHEVCALHGELPSLLDPMVLDAKPLTKPLDDLPLTLWSLPTLDEIVDPTADGREIFQRLRRWVRAERRAGRLEDAGMSLSSHYRCSIFVFLSEFSFGRSVFRRQAQEMLQRLASMDAWRRDGVTDDRVVARALGDSAVEIGDESLLRPGALRPDGVGSIDTPGRSDNVEAFDAQPSVRLDSGGDTPSTAASTPRGDTQGFGPELALAVGGSLSSDADAQAPFGGSLSSDADAQAPSVPSRADLEDPGANRIETLRQLSRWLSDRRERACLTAEAEALGADHRRAIISFLCVGRTEPVVTKRWFLWTRRSAKTERSKKSLFAAQAAGVLQSLADVDVWFSDEVANGGG